MMPDLPSTVLNVSIFGSAARKDSDAESDLDVLVVVANGSGRTDPASISTHIEKEYGRPPSISWYGLRKIRKLFTAGDLFAWHLKLESSLIAGKELAELVGEPAKYSTALADIKDLREISTGVGRSINVCPENAIFEMGILYVCARNIAMSASAVLNRLPSFGRYSPYNLGQIGFPIDRDEYQLMMRCRLAGQRGVEPPPVSAKRVVEAQIEILTWADSVVKAVAEKESADEQIEKI